MREEFVNNLPPACHVSLSDSGYVNEELFVRGFEFFQINRVEGKCLLILCFLQVI